MTKAALRDLISNPVRSEKVRHTQQNQFILHGPESHQRQSLESYIASKFHQTHNAEITEYMPILLEMTANDKTQAALGLRPGRYKPMFLEQYLDAPIEQKIAELAKGPIDRYTLMEIGNLVVTRPGAGLLLFVMMAISIAEAGYQWMTFTATPEVTRLIRRLGFEPLYLADANPDAINGGTKKWGGYYDRQPLVMAGSLEKAMAVMRDNPTLKTISIEYTTQIKALSNTLINLKHQSFLESTTRNITANTDG